MSDGGSVSETYAESVRKLEESLNYVFRDKSVAVQALTHSSARDAGQPCNERLEFFGDAILGHVVSEYLYHSFPNYEEGELSTMKSIVVSAKTLSVRARQMGLESLIILGRGLGEKRNLPRSILCNTFEAIVAALYLDGGMEIAREFVLGSVRDKIGEILKDEHEKNYKSLLQDYAQRHLTKIPEYVVTKEVGPDHKKMFEVIVELDGTTYGPAWGSNKKEAEQRVARAALEELDLLGNSKE